MSDVIWRPSPEHLERSNVARFMKKHGIRDYAELIRRSTDDIEWFWRAALEDIDIEWYRPYDRLLDMSKGFPWAQWFLGGTINIVHNCIDRHLRDHASAVAVLGERDDGSTRTLTYQQLSDQVCQLANALKGYGVTAGDAVGIYMPMTLEIVVAFFACLKMGAMVVPIFSGFGAEALAVRLADAEARILITSDGSFRRGKLIPLKPIADAAVASVTSVTKVVVLKHTENAIEWQNNRDVWWHDALTGQPSSCATTELHAEATALLLYTSGTTGRPKGTVHTHAGCLAQMGKELAYAFDVKRGEPFFWFTDIGWMMGPWEMIGVSLLGGTFLISEGAPDWPDAGRLWRMIEQHRVVTLGISPTAIRLLMRSGDAWPEKYDLSSLKILGSTGETWDPASYRWFFEKIGKKRCPVINISGGTEIVGCLLSPLPITELKACTLRGPGLGMDVDVFDDEGKPLRCGIGHLVCKKPAPSMTKGFFKDPERYLETYFSTWPNVWYHGDWASVDEDGFWFLHGRSDDTIKVAGKRTGPAEIESALMSHEAVSEAAAIGVPHDIKGEGVVCFVVLKPRHQPSEAVEEKLKEVVVRALGKTLRPEAVKFVTMLPKTRSAKILRGMIRKVYLGESPGDTASVDNPEALTAISRARELVFSR